MKSWFFEYWRFLAFVIPGLILGLILGSASWGLVAGLTVYLFWQFVQARRIEQWITSGRRDQPPHASGYWADIINITYQAHKRDRKRKKKLARHLKSFYESLSALPDAAIMLSENYQMDWFNSAARTLLGLKPEDMGRRVSNLLRTPEFIEYLEQGRFDHDMVIKARNNQETEINLRIVPFGKKQYLLLARDVTHIYQLERMRQDFIANVSHELRTPLTVISGYLESLTEPEYAEVLPDPINSSLNQMYAQSDRMQRLVEDLLQLSRLESDRDTDDHVVTSVPAILASIYEDAAALAKEKDQVVDLEIQENLWVIGDPQELHSAFSNLVFNAIRYTPEAGHITMRWYGDEQGGHYEVEDDGIGIEPQHLQRLTERFYRVDKDRSRMNGGTGLGLAIVKHVLQRHGASLHISSQPNQGSVFRCDFPVKKVVEIQDKKAAVTKGS